MKEINLIEGFSIIKDSEGLPNYSKDICTTIHRDGLDVGRKIIDSVLNDHGVDYNSIKMDLLDIIIMYINMILKDSIIRKTENQNVLYLKRLFKVKEGDFYKLKKQEIKGIIQQQLYNLYLDNSIDNDEAIFKVGLQDLFDLNYDQMSEFVNPIAFEALERGADIIQLDVVFPNFSPPK